MFVLMYYKGLLTVSHLSKYIMKINSQWKFGVIIILGCFCIQCDDETCKHTTRSISLRLVGDSERGTVCPNYPRCNGRLLRKVSLQELVEF